MTGELVYTGFTRTFLFGVASSAPVRGRLTPLMNEYFASIADVHRIMGVLDEEGRQAPFRRRQGKDRCRLDRAAGPHGRPRCRRSVAGRMARRRALVQRAAASQVHDAAFRVARRSPMMRRSSPPGSAAGRSGGWPCAWSAVSSTSPTSFPPTTRFAAKQAAPRRLRPSRFGGMQG